MAEDEDHLSGVLSWLGGDSSLPSSMGALLSSSLGLHSPPSTARQGGGCNDAYSAFAFLSFLFALLTFIQNNQGRRKRRAAGHECFVVGNVTDSREETSFLASAVMYQGFLGALDNGFDKDCSLYSLCQARKEVNRLGTIGSTIGVLGERKALQVLGLEGRGDYDIDHGECQIIFPCTNLPKHYKYPAVKR